MNSELVARRDRAAQRHDRALERWPDRGVGFEPEIDGVIAELKAVCGLLGPEREPAGEVARCWTWLGDAYFDRARGTEREFLEAGRACYERAEVLLGPTGDLQQRAKLDYNFANTLRGLSEGSNLALLRQAEQRYRRALDVFRRHLPHAVQACETALASIGQQIRVAEKAAGAENALGELQRILARARSGDTSGARAGLERFKAERPSVEQLAQGLLQEFDAMAAVLGLPVEQVSAAKEQVQDQLAAIRGPGGDATMIGMLDLLEDRLRADVESRKIDPARRRLLEGVMSELRDLAAESPGDDLTAMAAWSARMRDLMRRFWEVAQHTGAAVSGRPGGDRLTACIGALKQVVSKEFLVPHRPQSDAELTNHLMIEIGRLETDVQGLDDGDAIATVERDRLRPLAMQWRKYALRHALVLAWPDRWSCDPVSVEPNSLAWVGGDAPPAEVVELLRRRGLRVLEQGNLDAASAAWEWARRAAVVVAVLDGANEPRRAAACYQLGLARSSGAAVVLIKEPDEDVPFDLDIPPIDSAPGIDLAGELDERIEQALYRLSAIGERVSTLRDTLSLARRTLVDGLAPTLLGQVKGEREHDPLFVQGVLEQCVGLQRRAAPVLLTPPIPIPYPNAARPCCFHVTPFRRQFEAVRGAARTACQHVGSKYLHGAESTDPVILRAIWSDIGRSSHVVVDLTDLNANVAYELGIAHALGRRVLCIQRATEGKPRLFPAIERERITPYPASGGLGGLTAEIERFLRPDEKS